jgi:hypothetical protein
MMNMHLLIYGYKNNVWKMNGVGATGNEWCGAYWK